MAVLVKASFTQFVIAYISALTIILCLLISGQIIVQVTLLREVHVRNINFLVNKQELETQFILKEMILLQSPSTTYADAKAILTEIQQPVALWEQIQQAEYVGDSTLGLYPSDLSPGAEQNIEKVKPDFLAMDKALRDAVKLDSNQKTAIPDKLRPDVDVFFLDETDYVQAINNAANDLRVAEDAYVSQIRTVELTLFALTVITLFCEVFFIIRPATTYLRYQLNIYEEMMTMHTHMPQSEEQK